MEIVAKFEISEDFLKELKRIQKEYGFGPQQFLEETIYAFQSECWSDILSVTIDTPLQDWPVCYQPKIKR